MVGSLEYLIKVVSFTRLQGEAGPLGEGNAPSNCIILRRMQKITVNPQREILNSPHASICPSVLLDLSDHSHASSLRVRFTPCGRCCGVLSRFPSPRRKDPVAQMQGDGGHSFQLSPGEANENHFTQDHSFLLGKFSSNELLMQGYKVPGPRPQHERLLKGQPSSRALCCKCITVYVFPLLNPTSFIPSQGLILRALSDKLPASKFLSLEVCYPGNLTNHTSKS